MNSLSVTFDKGGPFYPGDTVTGKVVLTNPKPLKARSITISWDGISQTDVHVFSAPYKKQVLSGDSILWAPKSGEENLPASTHQFPISFKLPKDCPPTLNFWNTKNKYTVKVVVGRPWKKNLTKEVEFVVTKKLDLQGPNLRFISETYNNTGLFVNNGPIRLDVLLPTVVKPGQTIEITFKVFNNSSATLTHLTAELFKRAHYHARDQHTPCEKFHSCPLSFNQRGYRDWPVGKLHTAKVDIAPFTQFNYQMPFTISEKAKTPNFATGLMTFGYYLTVAFGIKGSPLLLNNTLSVSMNIGESPRKDLAWAMDSGAPPPYLF